MKRTVVALLLALALGAAAQEQVNLGLIPTPQRVEVDGEWLRVKGDGLRVNEKRVDTLPVEANLDQAYQLVVERRKVTVLYVGEEGLRNARLTLAQLQQIYGGKVPCCTITDWPAYRWRGWMDDQSRGPVPHQAFRKKQWQRLHALKYNFCNYYTEHTLYQPEFPDLAPAYLADCKPHPDEVINLQLFAHAEKTLRVPFYQYMMDSKANFDPSNEATYDFLRKRIKAAYDRFNVSLDTRPPFFIINCDETEQLGTGRAKKLVDSLGADQVYVNFINRCYEMVNEQGNPRVAMWGDIVAKNPAMMRQLPKDMIYDVTGSLCENNDKFAIDRPLPKIDRGDLLVFHDTGAHGHAMGFNYNGKLRSKELLLKEDGSVKLIRRAETLDDYFATLEGFWDKI